MLLPVSGSSELSVLRLLFSCGGGGCSQLATGGPSRKALVQRGGAPPRVSTSPHLLWARPGAVHGVAKSQTRLGDFTFTFHFHALKKEMATRSSVLAWRIPGTGEPGGLNAGDLGSIPGLGRFPGEGNGNPLQCSCLENPRDGGAWWAAVYGVTQSQIRLK